MLGLSSNKIKIQSEIVLKNESYKHNSCFFYPTNFCIVAIFGTDNRNQEIKSKNKQVGQHQTENCIAKESIKVKRQSIEQEERFANHVFDKGLTVKIHEELMQLIQPSSKNQTNQHADSQQTHRKMLNITNISKMQIKITRYHLIPGRGAFVKKIRNKRWPGSGEEGTLVHGWWECKLVQPLWKTVWKLLKKLKTELPWDPTILFLGI